MTFFCVVAIIKRILPIKNKPDERICNGFSLKKIIEPNKKKVVAAAEI